MGSIYKRVRKRPIPGDAEVITQHGKTMVVWSGKNGRKRKSLLADDGKHMLVKSETWCLAFTDENGLKQTESSKTTERDVAKQILAARERRVAEIRSGILIRVSSG